jgi:hypothetical protein
LQQDAVNATNVGVKRRFRRQKKAFVIIGYFASKSLSLLPLGVPGLQKSVFLTVALAVSAALLSCGRNTSSSTSGASGLKFRAFVSQAVSATTASPGLDLVDASTDLVVRAPAVVISGAPGMMETSANKSTTIVFDSTGNAVTVVNNKQETSSGTVKLPDATESMAISPDATVGYAAVPNAPVAGMPSGAVEMMNLSNFTIENTIAVTAAHYIVLSPDATHLLAFSDNSDTATLINFLNTGTTASPNWVVNGPPIAIAGFSRPVWAVFSADSNTAYVMNCGAECGATTGTAGVAVLNVGTATIGQTLAVPAGGATYGALFGSTLYVAGNPPAPPSPCSPATVNTCGTLSVITVNNGTLTLANSVAIPDGYHNRMAITADNQVFVGSRGCTNVNNASANPPTTYGCLALYNPKHPQSAVVSTYLGDTTGIAVVTGRNEVYVVQNGELRIWDTTTDAPRPGQFQPDIVGQAVDVKIID